MAAALGILHHNAASAQALAGAKPTPMAGAASGSGSTNSTSNSNSDSATISANDFLTLLVTEMRNQDPTAATDPNEYINQLVNVNSLQQLISINQNLSTALGDSSANTKANSATVSSANPAGNGASGAAPQTAGAGRHGGTIAGGQSTDAGAAAGTKQAPGNLSVPEAVPAAHSIANALSGRTHVRSAPAGMF